MVRGPTVPIDIRAFILGLLRGVAGEDYAPRQIVQLVQERFGITVNSKTISNWKSDIPGEMEKHGITDKYMQEIIARVIKGDMRPKEEILNDEDEEETIIKENKGKERIKKSLKLPAFKNTAEMISHLEVEGFTVTKGMSEIIQMLEANNMTVIDGSESVMGVEKLFIAPIDIDIELVGRNIAANPIIQFYYALERRQDPALDLTTWITSCLVEYYNNLDKITDGESSPIVIAVLYG